MAPSSALHSPDQAAKWLKPSQKLLLQAHMQRGLPLHSVLLPTLLQPSRWLSHKLPRQRHRVQKQSTLSATLPSAIAPPAAPDVAGEVLPPEEGIV